jgi:glyoxylase-like metal-dependent hydrolase (beta-lactamase superfamily II)
VANSPSPEDLGAGVWSVPVPIPGNPLGYTLVYALDSERGLLLVDAGWQHEDAWAALTSGLTTLGLDIADVYGVVVTHHHPDHAGLAGRVRDATGAWIAMHHDDAEIVRLFQAIVREDADRNWERDALLRAGAGGEDLTAVRAAREVEPPAEPDRELADGELVDLPGRKLRAIWTPGHSPGHICLHLEDGDRIFTGDHVLPRITPHIGLYPYDRPDVDPLGDFLTSLERVRDIRAAEVLPAHQYRFEGLADRALEIVEHHEHRLAELTALLSVRPATLWELSAGLEWRQPWTEMPPGSRRMAAGEAAAHLRTLENRGVARRHDGAEPLRYRLA